jgi:acyl-coenzyme A thioesterase PaaI-like protein
MSIVFIFIRIGVKAMVCLEDLALCFGRDNADTTVPVKLAHGGQMIALIWEALGIHFRTTLEKYRQLDTLSCHVEFLRTAMAGEAKVVVEDVSPDAGKGEERKTVLTEWS